ncbi:MAG: hypothetical protein AB8F78_15935 [Saprospiraceae bacterium]
MSCFFLFAVLVVGCKEEEMSFIPSGGAAFPSSERVEASFYGRLLDHEMQPVMEAEVWIEDRMVLSDSLGDWIIPKVEVVSRQAYIKIEAEGYFASSRVLSVLPNSLNLVRIMPTRKKSAYSIQSSDGGEVQLPDGSSVTFQPGSFIIEATGAEYDGEVHIYAYAIDGRSESSQVQMPGRLESTTEEAALVSFGMIVADLETPGGASIQLADDKPAAIRYEQAQLDANAPDTIPLWHFDEEIGTWVIDGFSVKEGNAYVGEVSHFSWWNCDWPEPIIDFCIQFECDEMKSLLANTSPDVTRFCLTAVIDVLDRNWNRSINLTLDPDLKLCDVIPASSEIRFIFSKDDGTKFLVGPFTVSSSDIDLGVHSIPCLLLSEGCDSMFPTPIPPPPPPPPLECVLVWSQADCENLDTDVWVRVASTVANSTPIVIDREFLKEDSIVITIPRNQRFIVSMISSGTGEVLGQKYYFPVPRVSIGALNPNTGIIDAEVYKVEGTLMGCLGPQDDAYIRLLAEDGTLIDETRSLPSGTFELHTTVCDARYVILSIKIPEGERVFTVSLFDDLDFGEISTCLSNGEYYFKGKVNDQEFEFVECNGRAGSSGWVAYAANEPDPNAPFFGLEYTDQISATGIYQVGPSEPIQFNGFRLGQLTFPSQTYGFVGQLNITEFGSSATGIFTGTCEGPDGETIDLEVEMRFVKP